MSFAGSGRSTYRKSAVRENGNILLTSKTRNKIRRTLLTWLVASAVFFPIFWMFLTAFKTEIEALQNPPRLLFTPTLDAIIQINGRVDYLHAMYNSILESVGGTAVCFAFALPASYALAFYPSKRNKTVLLGMMCTKTVPPVSMMIPVYLVFKDVGLLDTRVSIVLVNAALNMPVVVWMLYSFFRDVPREILEASRIDGAKPIQALRLIVIPLALPGIMSTFLLSTILCWNEAFWSITLTSSQAGGLTAMIATFSGLEGLFWAKLSAISVVAIAPMLMLGWLTQRHFVRGMTFGAVR